MRTAFSKDKIEEKIIKNGTNNKIKNHNTKNKKKTWNKIGLYILVLSSIYVSIGKMHEIRWQPEINLLSSFYDHNSTIVDEYSSIIQNDGMEDTLKKINFDKYTAVDANNINNKEAPFYDSFKEIMFEDYNRSYDIMLYVTKYSPELKKAFPIDEYTKLKIIQNINNRTHYNTLKGFRDRVNFLVRNMEKNIPQDRIEKMNNYFTIENKEIKNTYKNKDYISPNSYMLTTLIYNDTHKRNIINLNGTQFLDIDLANMRTLSQKVMNQLSIKFKTDQINILKVGEQKVIENATRR